ncbi:MAG: glycogen debranching enzyme, partial [Chloroflexi bacterium]|nr:glycogen debranching enzyme [Chloroflexota bacterium]
LAVRFHAVGGDVGFYLIANAYHEPLCFALPNDVRWRRLVDTALPSPSDFLPEDRAPLIEGETYTVQPNTVVVLIEGGSP